MSPFGETTKTQDYNNEYNDYNERPSYGTIISQTSSHQNLMLLNNSNDDNDNQNNNNNNNNNASQSQSNSKNNKKDEEKEKLLGASSSKVYSIRDEISYMTLMSTNKEFRLIFISFIITHMGEWLTYIASIALIQEQIGDGGGTDKMISYLVIIRLLPKVLLSWGLGGTIADSFDRRKTMIVLDLCGTPCALLFVLAYHFHSINLVYIATFLQQSIAGLYQPCACSIIPLVVSNDTQLKKATTLIGVAWSAMAAIGSALGGFIVAAFGSKNCFLIDSVTFFLSATLLWLIKDDSNGTHFNVQTTSSSYYQNNNNNNNNPTMDHNSNNNHNKDVENNNNNNDDDYYCCWWEQFKNMTINGIQYVRSSCFGVLILLKATGALSWGAADVLNVSFSSESPHEGFLFDSTQRLGILFCFMGVGCIVGPMIVEPYLDMNRTHTIQLSCIVSYFLITIGYLGWYGYQTDSNTNDITVGSSSNNIWGGFWSLCFFALIRSTGTSVLWINSGLLLQKFSPPRLLGRVMAIDYSLGLLSEAFSVYICGVLLDMFGKSPNQISLLMSFISFLFGCIWIIWYYTKLL